MKKHYSEVVEEVPCTCMRRFGPYWGAYVGRWGSFCHRHGRRDRSERPSHGRRAVSLLMPRQAQPAKGLSVKVHVGNCAVGNSRQSRSMKSKTSTSLHRLINTRLRAKTPTNTPMIGQLRQGSRPPIAEASSKLGTGPMTREDLGDGLGATPSIGPSREPARRHWQVAHVDPTFPAERYLRSAHERALAVDQAEKPRSPHLQPLTAVNHGTPRSQVGQGPKIAHSALGPQGWMLPCGLGFPRLMPTIPQEARVQAETADRIWRRGPRRRIRVAGGR